MTDIQTRKQRAIDRLAIASKAFRQGPGDFHLLAELAEAMAEYGRMVTDPSAAEEAAKRPRLARWEELASRVTGPCQRGPFTIQPIHSSDRAVEAAVRFVVGARDAEWLAAIRGLPLQSLVVTLPRCPTEGTAREIHNPPAVSLADIEALADSAKR